MTLATKVKRYLDARKLCYSTWNHARTVTLDDATNLLSLDASQVARAVILQHDKNLLMAILPLNRQLDFHALEKKYDTTFRVLVRSEVDRLFRDCEPGSHPPVPGAYGLSAILDSSLTYNLDYIFFEPGAHTSMVRMSTDEFNFMLASVPRANISQILLCDENGNCHWRYDQNRRQELKHISCPQTEEIFWHVSKKYDLPSMPKIAKDLLSLAQSQQELNSGEVLKIIAEDEIITAEVIKYAQQYIIKQNKNISCLSDIVQERLLDFDSVSHIALGIATNKVFKMPTSGPLSNMVFWRQAFYSAVLAQELAKATTAELNLKPNYAYLAGLLHNFGLLLLAHLFRPEFQLLGKMLVAYPKIPINMLEKRILGMGRAQQVVNFGHAMMGAWLLQSWQLPDEIVVAAKEHHHENYKGDGEMYVALMQLTGRILKKYDIGDASSDTLSDSIIEKLGLSVDKIDKITASVMARCARIDDFIKKIAV